MLKRKKNIYTIILGKGIGAVLVSPKSHQFCSVDLAIMVLVVPFDSCFAETNKLTAEISIYHGENYISFC